VTAGASKRFRSGIYPAKEFAMLAVRHLMLGILGVALLGGSAWAAERTVPVSAVRAVSAQDGVRVDLGQGAPGVVVEGPEALLDRVEITERDGKVRVQPRRSLGLFGSAPSQVVVRITAPSLEEIRAQNGAVVTGRGLGLGALRVLAENGAVVTLDGACAEGAFAAERGGVLRAERLSCESVSAEANMGGVAQLEARSAISAKASFGGVVEVRGNPGERISESSMGGAVRFLGAKD